MPLMKKKLTPQVISENVTIIVKSLSNLLMISVGFFFLGPLFDFMNLLDQ